MTVTSTGYQDGPFTANGVTTSFPFTFSAVDATDVAVARVRSDGTLSSMAGFSVTLNSGAGGSVNFSTAPAAGDPIYIYLNPDFAQETDFATQGSWSPDSMDKALDKAALRDLALKRTLDRAVLAPFGETTAPLPPLATRAGKFPVWDANGNFAATTGTGADAALRGDLALSTGAALIGRSGGGTVQDLLNKLGTEDLSASPAAAISSLTMDKTWAGEAGDDSDYRGLLISTKFTGVHGGFQQNCLHLQCEVRNAGSATPLTYGQGCEAYVRLGLDGTTDGNLSVANVFAGHVANEAPTANITTAIVFRAKDTDFNDGGVPASNGGIVNNYGLYVGNLSHATKLTGQAAGVYVNNMTTPGAGVTVAAVLSDMAGSGKWTLLSRASSPSAHFGAFRIGDTTVPTDKLEVKGYAKLSGDGTIGTAGTFHELRSPTSSQFAAQVANSHATAPHGLDIYFPGGAPNNTTQMFVRARDTGATRWVVYSNGNVVNANNSYGAISDRRIKKEIRNATPQLADIRALRVVSFKLKHDESGRKQIGLIAQEVEEISPGLVYEQEDGKKGVNYSVLYMKAVKALQELAEIVEKQGKEIAALKAKG